MPTSFGRRAKNVPRLAFLLALLAWCGSASAGVPTVDLSRAVVFQPTSLSKQERKAVEMLVDEVRRRSQITWNVVEAWPVDGDLPVIAVGKRSDLDGVPGLAGRLGELAEAKGAEGYQLTTSSAGALIVGNDARGVLFGVGRLLRELRIDRGKIVSPEGLKIATAPAMTLRGHQLGYRPKTNSYDAWDVDRWEQYIRDLAIFGTNAIELIPPRSDDDADSPHFPRPPLDMMVEMSRLADEYGLDVWIWYPAMDADYSDPATVAFALREWAEVVKRLPRVDALFVPGGDPGHTRPKFLFELLEKQSASLKQFHPKMQMWVSPQSFDATWYDEFLSLMKAEPKWLDGVVFGPQVRIGLPELRKQIPSNYPIRNYPDITHTLKCQYPVRDWDVAFALTQDREVINPRPLDQAAIFKACQPDSIGFLTYSEGCHDDVNKFVWSGLGWDPDADVLGILRDYGRVFIGHAQADAFANGLLALERNWRGPIATNSEIVRTLQQFQDLERDASPAMLSNWRFQQALYRANYDAMLRERTLAETAAQAEAFAWLGRAQEIGAGTAIVKARAALASSAVGEASRATRTRVFELAEALFQSIGMQMSVPKYAAIALGRGTHLDTIDLPLNDRRWLESQFVGIEATPAEADRIKKIDAILKRTDPGPGGFYDNLGELTRQPHLVRGRRFEEDPDFRHSALIGFARHLDAPIAWCRNAQSLYDQPLEMRYEGLDPEANYRLRVMYAGDSPKIPIGLEAEGTAIHPIQPKPDPVGPLEFDLPAGLTSDGTLELKWTVQPGRGGNGRGCHVSEVWLIRSPAR